MQKANFVLLIFILSLSKLCGQWTGTSPISTNSHVGIGTSTPTRLLEISNNGGNAANIMLQLTNQYSGGGLNEPTIRFDNGSNGTYWDIGANVAGQEYFRISYKGWQSGGVQENILFMNGDGKIAMGDVPMPNGYRLFVKESILTEKLKIALSNNQVEWADFVFDDLYKLMPLSEVKQYIEAENHLPNMPSACELEEEGGIDVHKMLLMQQQKIEELYLYIIELEQKIVTQSAQK